MFNWNKRFLLLACMAWVTISSPVAFARLIVDANLPAGNIVLEKVVGDTVCLSRELRDTQGDWFYWAFRVKGAKGRTLTFSFDKRIIWGGPVGVRGPAVTTDAGKSWSYPCDGKSTKNAFSYAFDTDDEVRFYETWQYLPPDWDAFLSRHASDRGRKFETGVLCTTRKGRAVPNARFGRLDGHPKYRIFMSSRHHCSEATATPVLEGVAAAFLADDALGRWLCENVELMLVPFVDYDGAIEGDQGKQRAPHDHNRDYTEFIYPETRAIRDWIASHANNRLDIFLDIHCPWIRDNADRAKASNEFLYTPWKNPEVIPNLAAERRYSQLLEQLQCGSMRYRAADDLPFGKLWNTGKNYAQGLSAVNWACRKLQGLTIARTYEVPFANANGAVVTPRTCRDLGRDTAKVFRALLTELEQAKRPFVGSVPPQARAASDLQDVVALLSIPSVSANVAETDRAIVWMQRYLEKRGVWCVMRTYPQDSRKILYAATRPNLLKPDYMLVTHLDVVYAPKAQFSPRIEKGRIYARGACDTKVNAFCGAKALVALKDAASVGCVFSSDEEIGGNTTKYMVSCGLGEPQKGVLVLDAGSFSGDIRYACKGNAYYKVTAFGKSGHSSMPEKCDNPFYKLFEAALRIRDEYPHQKPGEWGNCASVTIAKGGDSQNRIPEMAEMTVNVRFVEDDGLEVERQRIARITGLATTLIRGTPAAVSRADDPEILRMQSLMRNIYPERKVSLIRGVAANDSRYYPQFKKPMMSVSMDHDGGHSDNEWCRLDDIPRFTSLLIAYLR